MSITPAILSNLSNLNKAFQHLEGENHIQLVEENGRYTLRIGSGTAETPRVAELAVAFFEANKNYIYQISDETFAKLRAVLQKCGGDASLIERIDQLNQLQKEASTKIWIQCRNQDQSGLSDIFVDESLLRGVAFFAEKMEEVEGMEGVEESGDRTPYLINSPYITEASIKTYLRFLEEGRSPEFFERLTVNELVLLPPLLEFLSPNDKQSSQECLKCAQTIAQKIGPEEHLQFLYELSQTYRLDSMFMQKLCRIIARDHLGKYIYILFTNPDFEVMLHAILLQTGSYDLAQTLQKLPEAEFESLFNPPHVEILLHYFGYNGNISREFIKKCKFAMCRTSLYYFPHNFHDCSQDELIVLLKIMAINGNHDMFHSLFHSISKCAILDELARAKIVKIAIAYKYSNAVVEKISAFNITDQAAIIEIAQLIMDQDPMAIILHIRAFRIRDESVRVEMAKTVARTGMFFNLLKFHMNHFEITSEAIKDEILEIARLNQ